MKNLTVTFVAHETFFRAYDTNHSHVFSVTQCSTNELRDNEEHLASQRVVNCFATSKVFQKTTASHANNCVTVNGTHWAHELLVDQGIHVPFEKHCKLIFRGETTLKDRRHELFIWRFFLIYGCAKLPSNRWKLEKGERFVKNKNDWDVRANELEIGALIFSRGTIPMLSWYFRSFLWCTKTYFQSEWNIK